MAFLTIKQLHSLSKSLQSPEISTAASEGTRPLKNIAQFIMSVAHFLVSIAQLLVSVEKFLSPHLSNLQTLLNAILSSSVFKKMSATYVIERHLAPYSLMSDGRGAA